MIDYKFVAMSVPPKRQFVLKLVRGSTKGFQDFALSEVESLAELYGLDRKTIFTGGRAAAHKQFVEDDNPYVKVNLPSKQVGLSMLTRAVMVRAVYEIWGEGTGVPECIAVVRAYTDQLRASTGACADSFNVSFEPLGRRKVSASVKAELRPQFQASVQSTGEITKNGCKHSFLIIMDYLQSVEHKHTEGQDHICTHYQFVRVLGVNDSGNFGKFTLKKRKYIGPTSTDARLAFLMTNMGQVTKKDLVFDPFVGTGSLLIASAVFGAKTIGSDFDWLLLHGRTKAKGGYHIYDSFKQYGLGLPELLCSDSSLPLFLRPESIDAIITDPPYGVRAGARKSGRAQHKQEARKNKRKVPRLDDIPPSQVYDVEDVMYDLLDKSARILKVGSKLVFLMPVPAAFDAKKEIPHHPCLVLSDVCEQVLRRDTMSRLMITMTKTKKWSAEDKCVRRDKANTKAPDWARMKELLGLERKPGSSGLAQRKKANKLKLKLKKQKQAPTDASESVVTKKARLDPNKQ